MLFENYMIQWTNSGLMSWFRCLIISASITDGASLETTFFCLCFSSYLGLSSLIFCFCWFSVLLSYQFCSYIFFFWVINTVFLVNICKRDVFFVFLIFLSFVLSSCWPSPLSFLLLLFQCFSWLFNFHCFSVELSGEELRLPGT